VAHYSYSLARINKFIENPDEFKQELILPSPPGQPIGETPQMYCEEY
jgi:hypothetical protein